MPGRSESRRRATHACRRPADRGTRPHVVRPRRGPVRRPGIVPVRADGLGRPALPPVHERHDCEAEGHRAYDRRLSRGGGDDTPLRLRPEAGDRRLLVRGGHRLGDRAQLHRLRAALQRCDERPLRGHSRLPRQGPLVGDRRALRRHDPVHGADRDPRAHEVGARVRRPTRPLVASAARNRRRADQPGSLDLVPRAHRRRSPSRGRHVVADGDRDDHDHAASGRHDGQAGRSDEAVSRSRSGRRRRPRVRKSAPAAVAISCSSGHGPR